MPFLNPKLFLKKKMTLVFNILQYSKVMSYYMPTHANTNTSYKWFLLTFLNNSGPKTGE